MYYKLTLCRSLKRLVLVLLIATLWTSQAFADEQYYRLRMFFGLSMPDGGAVSLNKWQDFEANHITEFFDGFNIVDSTGYYQGKPERSKVMSVIVTAPDISKAKALSKRYATLFKQESVMIVVVEVNQWMFVTPDN